MSDGEFLMRCESPVEPPKIRVKFESKVVLPWSSALEAAYEMAGGHHSDLRVKHAVRATALPALSGALAGHRLAPSPADHNDRPDGKGGSEQGETTRFRDERKRPGIRPGDRLCRRTGAGQRRFPRVPGEQPGSTRDHEVDRNCGGSEAAGGAAPGSGPEQGPLGEDLKEHKSIPFEMAMAGGLLKSMSDCDCTVKEPKIVSSPSPVKVWTKTPTGLVGVSVEFPRKSRRSVRLGSARRGPP